MNTTEQALADITALFEQQGGADYYGEPVSQLAHALQCAHLAESADADNDTVVAALLHDIGHLLPGGALMANYGRLDHERGGADFLRRRGFSEKVAQLIEHHVDAKRYLTHKHPAYAAALSEASRQTLAFQGGPMTPEEARRFEQHPFFAEILQVRRWDEAAKRPGWRTPELAHYLARCRAHLSRHP